MPRPNFNMIEYGAVRRRAQPSIAEPPRRTAPNPARDARRRQKERPRHAPSRLHRVIAVGDCGEPIGEENTYFAALTGYNSARTKRHSVYTLSAI